MATEHPILDKRGLGVIHVAAKKKSRFAMDGVLIDGKGLTATDGKSLVHVTHVGFPLEGVEPFVLGLEDAKELNKSVGVGKKARPFKFDVNSGTALRGGESRTFEEVPGTFPPWEDVIPDDRDSTNDIGIRASRLVNVLKAAIAFGGKDVKLRMSVKNDSSAIVFTSLGPDGRKFTGVLMPEPL